MRSILVTIKIFPPLVPKKIKDEFKHLYAALFIRCVNKIPNEQSYFRRSNPIP